MEALQSVCPILESVFETEEKFSPDLIYEAIEDMAPKIDDVLDACRWKGKRFKCSERFAPVFTRFGLCFAFNALNSHDFYTDE